MTRSLEAKRRRNRKGKRRQQHGLRAQMRDDRIQVWRPPAEMLPQHTADERDWLEHLEAQRALLQEISDGDDPPRDG